jgi:predicted Holliday junction resolvase-like endonuclease
MEIVLALIALVAVGAIIYANREVRSLDVNRDGKVDLDDAKAAITNTLATVKETADVNKDGRIDVADVKAAVKKTAAKAQTAAKKTATKAKEAVKKSASGRGRRPRSKS